MQHLYPEAKLTIGPAIDSGFYYDIDVEKPFVAEDLEKKIQWEKVADYIKNMEDEREKEIIILRYGLDNKKPLAQREVAARLNISRSYVSRIEKKVLSDIKKHTE